MSTETTVSNTESKKPVAKKVPAKKVVAKKQAKGGKAKAAKQAARKPAVDWSADAVKVDDKKKIKVLASENPKRGKGAKRFALYRNGMTVEAALEKGVTRADVRWDVAHRYISLQ